MTKLSGQHTGSDTGDRLHSVESAGQFLGGVAASTIRFWIWQGKLTRVKVGRLTRVRESELRGMITQQDRESPKVTA